MRHCVQVIYVLTLAAMASAHFQLLFPSPRGPFVDVNEPSFCDGYNNPAANRTQFPLSSGFFSLNSEHPQWTAGVLVSSAANATSFNNFSQVKPFFQQQGEGAFCFPLNFSANANGTSLQDGQNVTIQIMFNGGDGNLFQCADLTLSSSVQISSSVSCSNATSSTSTASGASTPSPTGKSSGTVEKAKSVAELAAMLGACWIAFLVL